MPTTAQRWTHITPGLTDTFLAYLDQLAVSLRASTVARAESILREFAGFVTDTDPAVARVADLRRTHIETYKLHLNQRPSLTGGVLSKQQPGQPPRRAPVLLRAAHRMGRHRPTGRGADVLR